MKKRIAIMVCAIAMALCGCDEEEIAVGGPNPWGSGGGGGAAGAEEAEGETRAAPSMPVYRDEEFVEADTNRDPFRNYAASFRATGPDIVRGGREVKMPNTSIEEMRLIGLVTGVANPRAMLIDRQGVGHVVRRGEYLGRSEVVQAGGTEDLSVTLNWRVDRIRAGELVLTRADPTAPNRPPLTRVIPLREEEENDEGRN